MPENYNLQPGHMTWNDIKKMIEPFSDRLGITIPLTLVIEFKKFDNGGWKIYRSTMLIYNMDSLKHMTEDCEWYTRNNVPFFMDFISLTRTSRSSEFNCYTTQNKTDFLRKE